MATSPSAISTGLTLNPWKAGSQSEGGNGCVPLVEPMPGRFHGPKHQVDGQAAGDEVEAQPPKISLTLP